MQRVEVRTSRSGEAVDSTQRLAHVFVELADTLVEDFDVVDFLHMLTERCAELLDGHACGLMLADQRGGLQLMASTMDRARILELFELEIREGPCMECFSTGTPITNVALQSAGQRWPAFTPAALDAGFRLTHALPMRLRNRVIGALNLFSDDVEPLDGGVLAIGQAMADVATIGLLHQRTLNEQTALAEQLQTALHSRVLIEQAKGVLAAQADIDVAEAFTRMRAHARRNGRTLTTVATAVVEGSLTARVLAQA